MTFAAKSASDADRAAFRHEVRALLAAELPHDWKGMGALSTVDRNLFVPWWRKVLRQTGLLTPTWPTEYGGRGLNEHHQAILAEEFVRVGVPVHPAPNDPLGFILLAPTVLQWGTTEQKDYFLPLTASGQIRWAQGFSEPEAGSDLFNLRTRARIDGEDLVIDGHKMWQTAGVSANWVFALIRTEPSERGGHGLSFVLVPLDQQGVQVRGITTMTGDTEVAEIYFSSARTALSNVIGGLGNGATVAASLLGLERGADGVSTGLAHRIELDRLLELARSSQAASDPHLRLRLVEAYTSILAFEAMAATILELPDPAMYSSVSKLLVSEYRQRVTDLAIDILGPRSLVGRGSASMETLSAQPLGTDIFSTRVWLDDMFRARPGTVYGGASEVQRNLVAERLLGLPKEPRPQGRAKEQLNSAGVSV